MFWRAQAKLTKRMTGQLTVLTDNKRSLNCDNRRIERRTNGISSLHSHWHHGLTDRRPITSALNWPIRSITRVKYHQLTWYNSLWLWRWLLHRLSKRQSLSTTVLTTFTRTIMLNLLMKWLLVSNLSHHHHHYYYCCYYYYDYDYYYYYHYLCHYHYHYKCY